MSPPVVTSAPGLLSFPKLKRRLVGWLALVAPVPLPFNEIVHPFALLVYLALVIAFLRRSRRDEGEGAGRWLPNWAVNVLALVYLPFFFFDAFVLSGGQLVRPVVHLLLFAVLVKLYSFQREKDKWQTLVAAVFLFLASMATSVHPSVVMYLIVFVALTVALLARFACLNVLAGYGRKDAVWAETPLRSFLVPATIATLVLAVPFFLVLPRIRAPFLMGPGAGAGGTLQPGISGEVNLDTIGLARGNTEVVLRVEYSREPLTPEELRFRLRAHDVFRGNAWSAGDEAATMLHQEPTGWGLFLAPGKRVAKAEVLQLPALDGALAIPAEALTIDFDNLPLFRTALGTVPKPAGRRGAISYEVTLAAGPVAVPGEAPGPGSPSLEISGISAEIQALARERAVGDTPRRRALAIERFLQREYEYTEAFIGSGASIDDFLLRYKSGHCEYFASAMVLLLRSVGVPARLATGYLGAEANPFQRYHVVRQSNAHAWVEVYLADEGGWVVFDPTPISGRPVARGGITGLLSQAYDLLVMQWDRYVLTYGLNDQMRLFLWARDAWDHFWRFLSPRSKAKLSRFEAAEAAEGDPTATARKETLSPWWLAALLLPALGGLAWWRRRQREAPLRAQRLYGRLRRQLARAGEHLDEATAPLAVRALARRRFPEAVEAVDGVIAAYLAESFGGAPLAQRSATALAAGLKALARAKSG